MRTDWSVRLSLSGDCELLSSGKTRILGPLGRSYPEPREEANDPLEGRKPPCLSSLQIARKECAVCKVAVVSRRKRLAPKSVSSGDSIERPFGHPVCFLFFLGSVLSSFRSCLMDLEIWLPALFVLGLATMGLLFAFLRGCEKV
jgi:hypothetical protein